MIVVQVSIDGLRSVPLDILKRLDIVPEAYLQELGEDHDLFAELPVAVQRQACPPSIRNKYSRHMWYRVQVMQCATDFAAFEPCTAPVSVCLPASSN